MTGAICKKCWVSGRVQGVFFRGSTARKARQLGVSGHAINLDDGRVEVLACGNKDAVEELVQWLHRGPPAARVDQVISEEHRCTMPSGFETG